MMPRFSRPCRQCVGVCCGGVILFFLSFTSTLFTLSSNIIEQKHFNNYEANETLGQKITHLLPSLPMEFWERNQDIVYDMFYENYSCAAFPNIFSLKFNNLFWQTFKVENTTFQLYKAFYDIRRLNDLKNCVHILGMTDNVNFTQEIFCQIWFDNKLEPLIVGTTMYRYIWTHEWGDPGDGKYGPYLVSCQLPDEELQPPSCVSLVKKQCDQASNILKVIYDIPEKKEEFAVCVKGLDFLEVDLSIRIVEWLEFLFLMGVHKVFFYKLQVHPNIEKVLQYYTTIGRVDVTDITLPGNQPNLPILQHQFLENNLDQQCYDELIPYNDCFYRNLYSYEYIALLDIDEVIIPVKDANYSQLIKRVRRICKSKNEAFASYNARNVYFLDNMTPKDLYNNIPSYMHMVKHTHRAKKFTNLYEYVKSFFDPKKVITVHNHLPMESSYDVDVTYSMKTKHAQMNHYRHDCVGELDCDEYRNNTVQDKTMWQFKDKLIARVSKVLSVLKLI